MALTILIADADPALLVELEECGQREGWQVITAEDGLTALSSIDFCCPDLTCLSADLPGGTGWSVVQMMSDDQRLRNTPAMLLLDQSNDVLLNRCRQLGIRPLSKGPRLAQRWVALVHEMTSSSSLSEEECKEASTENEIAAVPSEVQHDIDRRAVHRADEAQQTNRRTSKAGSRGWAQSFMSLFRRHEENVKRIALASRGLAVNSNNENTTAILQRPKSSTPCVLIVEDDFDLSTAMKCRLETHGVAVIRAFDGMEGYRAAVRYPIDVILLDYEMPNGQGDYILRRLKETPVTQDIPVLMLTGKSDKYLERRVIGMGAEQFLTKPIAFDTLRKVLARYIDVLEQAPGDGLLETVHSHSSPSAAPMRGVRDRVGV